MRYNRISQIASTIVCHAGSKIVVWHFGGIHNVEFVLIASFAFFCCSCGGRLHRQKQQQQQ